MNIPGRFILFIFIVFRLGIFGVCFGPKRFGALGRSENEKPFSTPTFNVHNWRMAILLRNAKH